MLATPHRVVLTYNCGIVVSKSYMFNVDLSSLSVTITAHAHSSSVRAALRTPFVGLCN